MNVLPRSPSEVQALERERCLIEHERQESQDRTAEDNASSVLAVDDANVDAKRLKAQALMELGERQTSANARNYYLSVAQYPLQGLPAR
jgi:alkyl sulfatase BDS1-like metallo-beta-lactamase superfamily hydrolase